MATKVQLYILILGKTTIGEQFLSAMKNKQIEIIFLLVLMD